LLPGWHPASGAIKPPGQVRDMPGFSDGPSVSGRITALGAGAWEKHRSMHRLEAPAALHMPALPDLEACMTPDHDLKGATRGHLPGCSKLQGRIRR
jgi:hypothetical protein